MSEETKKTGIEAARETRDRLKPPAPVADDTPKTETSTGQSSSSEVVDPKSDTPVERVSKEKPSTGKVVKKEKASEIAKVEDVAPAQIENGQLILTPKHIELIQKQIAPTATKEELELFLMMAYRTRLDPLLKQLYFIKYDKKDQQGNVINSNVSYVTSIDGFRIIAHRTGEFAGIDEPKFTYVGTNAKIPSTCTITVYKSNSDRGFTATVHFSEYNTNKNLWVKMPHTMIAKVAEAHALRKAFPQDLSGIYTTDEMDQSGEASKSAPEKPKEPMMSASEWADVKRLTLDKGKTLEDLAAFMKKKFGHTSPARLTKKQYEEIMTKLVSLPDPTPPEELEETGEGTTFDDEELDKIDKGMQEMEAAK